MLEIVTHRHSETFTLRVHLSCVLWYSTIFVHTVLKQHVSSVIHLVYHASPSPLLGV